MDIDLNIMPQPESSQPEKQNGGLLWQWETQVSPEHATQ
jgi:hypothetical protein